MAGDTANATTANYNYDAGDTPLRPLPLPQSLKKIIPSRKEVSIEVLSRKASQQSSIGWYASCDNPAST